MATLEEIRQIASKISLPLDKRVLQLLKLRVCAALLAEVDAAVARRRPSPSRPLS